VHEGLTTDWAYKLPDEVWAIPDEERAARALCSSDLCQFGDRFFIRCVLSVPFTETEGSFNWGCWAEVDWPVFRRYLSLYDADGSDEPRQPGTLANALFGYPGSLGASCEIQFGESTRRPALFTPLDDQSLLAAEQRAGYDAKRYHMILDGLYTRR
jgi:hypothetical protein